MRGVADVAPSRREFLASSLALLADDKPKRVPVVDAHVHCFAGAKDRDYPYHKDAPYKPAEAATPQALLKAMEGAGVDHAVIVHPEPYQDSHEYLEYCLKQDKKRLKGTCLFFADRDDAPKKLGALAKKCSLVTLRIHAYAPERQPPFGKAGMKALWKQAADLGLAVQLHFEPRYAPRFEPYIKEFSKTTVIVDHLGRPFQGTPKEHKVVIDWSKHKNVVMKISALPEPEKYPHRKIAPTVKRLSDAYGASRLIYGGGWSAGVTAKAYRGERERIAGYLAHLSADERSAVLGGNAAKLFGFTS
jgi:predicted TIM-barrel fold metal-dependent hydrolase